MITLNDYLFSGDTVLKILHQYSNDLRNSAKENHNSIDLSHSNFLIQIIELLEHNDFLTSQSQRIKEFYKYMTREYPFLAFTFKGRIKSLIRAEEKFNGYILEYIYKYYKAHGKFPSEAEIKSKLICFRDLIAYRIVISMPSCHIKNADEKSEIEKKYLYEIADVVPEFLEERGFTAELSGFNEDRYSDKLKEAVRPYYRDYVTFPRSTGYQSIHITFYDNLARCYTELQLRTKDMDDFAEIGDANHFGYEKLQETRRTKRDEIPIGECVYFDDAYERLTKLQELELANIDVNMFKAINNQLINDGCGLFRGRQILPFEHLSRFQNDLID
ncbi:MAG: guanosine polyphosphate pyrophosphohydrolase [Ruminococcus sp.]|uniref:guanosine polyphosphate pyrophosphohydrolase n=1 Tax=Ruminococcus sp. TaxID=41978 RepID=UPI001B126105|nr:guanosine polyphosphate pyrophosphohydrolase [Ruminococcus sp.]MBO7473392.1 guanosine polyphosphate pyrophosphohydrolase [Ruminococcus sp.]